MARSNKGPPEATILADRVLVQTERLGFRR
jgi:hypothetical protein